MKKFVSLLFVSLFSVVLFAQDIIITNKAEQLKVKITEVSSEEVKYKELDNVDGPIFILKAEEINSVVFSNGKYMSFSGKSEINKEVNLNNVETVQKISAFRYKYKGEIISKGRYYKMLKTDCPQAFEKIRIGNKLIGLANLCLFPGGALIVGGVSNQNGGFLSNEIDATAFFIVGAALIVTSIPLRIIGGSVKRSSIVVFNEKCARAKTASHLYLNIKPNGLSLALNF